MSLKVINATALLTFIYFDCLIAHVSNLIADNLNLDK